VLYVRRKTKPYSGVLLYKVKQKPYHKQVDFILNGDLIDQLQTTRVFSQDLSEVCITLALKFSLEAAPKSHLEPKYGHYIYSDALWANQCLFGLV